MATRDFFLPEARTRVAGAIEQIERETAAEVVVAVRRRSGHYRHTDLYAGLALSLLMLLVLLFHPYPFEVEWMPANVLVAFAAGALLVGNVAALRRLFTSKHLLRENARMAARAAFYDMGISRTMGRTGILVYVSIFERRVEVVPDSAVKPDELGAEWGAAVAALQRALHQAPDFDGFLRGLLAMTSPLARALPIQPGDINELPNEPVVS